MKSLQDRRGFGRSGKAERRTAQQRNADRSKAQPERQMTDETESFNRNLYKLKTPQSLAGFMELMGGFEPPTSSLPTKF